MQEQSATKRHTDHSRASDMFCCAMMLALSGIFGVAAFGHWPDIIERLTTRVEWVQPRSLIHIRHYGSAVGVRVAGSANSMSSKLRPATFNLEPASSARAAATLTEGGEVAAR